MWKGGGSDRKIGRIGQYETDRIVWIGTAAQSLCGLDFMVVKG